MEVLFLALTTTCYGTFRDSNAYGFNMVTVWLYTFSTLLGSAWFNPMQFEWRYVRTDFDGWVRWLLRPVGPQDTSWRTWYESTAQKQYEQVGIFVRLARLVRMCRLLIPATLLAMRFAEASTPWASDWKATPPPVSKQLPHIIAHMAAGFALLPLFEALYWLARLFRAEEAVAAVASGHGHGAPAGPAPTSSVDSASLTHIVLYGKNSLHRWLLTGGLVGTMAVLVFWSALSRLPVQRPGALLDSLFSFFFFAFFWSRVCNIAGVRWLRNGTRGVHKVFDVLVGLFLIGVQALLAIIVPFGHVMHTALLFGSTYNSVVSLLGSSSSLLLAQQNGTASKTGAGHAGAVAIPEAEPKPHRRLATFQRLWQKHVRSRDAAASSETPRAEINIGVRNYRLRPLPPLTDLERPGMAGSSAAVPTADDTLKASQRPAAIAGAGASDSASGGGAFSTITLPPLPGGTGTEASAVLQHAQPDVTLAAVAVSSSAQPARSNRKSLKEIVAEAEKDAAHAAAVAAASASAAAIKDGNKHKKHGKDDSHDDGKGAGKGKDDGNAAGGSSVLARAAMWQKKAASSAE